jgi:hypothetical protein
MPVSPTEVRWYLSNPNAATGFSGIGTPGNSLGKWMSTTQVSDVAAGDLFLDLSAAQNVALQVDYQCLFIANFTASLDYMRNPYVWMPSAAYTFGGAAIQLAADPIGPLPYGSALPQAQSISASTTAPAVAGWYGPSPVYNPGGLLVPDIPPGYATAVWIQRTATNCPAITPQSLSLQCTFASDA